MKEKLQQAVDALVLAGGNKSQAAADLGLPRSTLRDLLVQAQRAGVTPSILPPDEAARLQRVKIQYEDRIRELEALTRNQARQDLTTESVRRYIFDLAERSPEPPAWTYSPSLAPAKTPGIPTLHLSDFHWGEVVDPANVNGHNTFNTRIAEERLQRLVGAAIDVAHNHMVNPRYEGLIVLLGGDMVSGTIHDELAENNDGATMQAVFQLFDHLAYALDVLAGRFGRVFVVGVYGNHGRNTPKPRHKAAAYTNFDWLLYNMLERHFKALGDDRFQFLIPAGFDALYRVHNTTYLCTHGDRLGAGGGDGVIGMLGPIARGIKKVKTQYATLGHAVDWVVLGHFHQRLILDNPGGMVNGCLKGWDEYAMAMRFDPAPPTQNLWWTHPKHGVTFATQIFLDPVQAADAPWVTWSLAA